MSTMRLQKYMSKAGFCSRREAEKYIAEGLVKINGAVAAVLGTKVDTEIDKVEVNENLLEIINQTVYIALNKPKGYVTSCNQNGDNIVLDLVDITERIVPVGRLDKDSTGLLILTNDGNFHHRLLHPSFDHEKEYEVTLSKPLP
ncbi:MAG: rRNA pseudouridine synthase, partial [Deltaproteobacteria bacterium]|nr:rRNA pseudouridine synthase [Deltaproteobacteria bacterium]